ncbi:hypothetical protein D3C77_164660 [compost metagenome]
MMSQHHRLRSPSLIWVPAKYLVNHLKAPLLLQGQVEVIGRISGDDAQPSRIHRVFLLNARLGDSLGPHQDLNARCPDIQVTGLMQLQTQVGVDPRRQQRFLIETTSLQEQLPTQNQALTAQRSVVLINLQALLVSSFLVGESFKSTPDRAAQTKHRTCTVHLAVGGQQLAANCPHFRTLGMV